MSLKQVLRFSRKLLVDYFFNTCLMILFMAIKIQLRLVISQGQSFVCSHTQLRLVRANYLFVHIPNYD